MTPHRQLSGRKRSLEDASSSPSSPSSALENANAKSFNNNNNNNNKNAASLDDLVMHPIHKKKQRRGVVSASQQLQEQTESKNNWLVHRPETRTNNYIKTTSSKNSDQDHHHDHLNVTLDLFDQLFDTVGTGSPLTVAAQAFDILAQLSCDSKSDAALRQCCFRTLRSTLCTIPNPLQAISAVWNAMERHMESAVVQQEACKLQQRLWMDQSLLFWLDDEEEEEEQQQQQVQQEDDDDEDSLGSSFHTEFSSTLSQLKRVQQRGFSVLFRSMQRHLDNPMIQRLALDLIRRLKDISESTTTTSSSTTAPASSSNKDQQQQQEQEEQSRLLVQAIVAALQRHVHVAYVQQMGLMLLAWLTENAACRQAVVEADACRWIPAIMRTHVHDALIQCNAAATLCWIIHTTSSSSTTTTTTTSSSSSTPAALVASDLHVVLDILQLHLDNASTFGNCVCLLCALPTTTPTTATAAADNNDTTMPAHLSPAQERHVLDLVLAGMSRHVTSAKVQEACLRWLRCRGFHRMLAIQQQQQPQQEDETKTVADVAVSLERCIPLVLQGMRYHVADAHLQAQALDVLVLLADLAPLVLPPQQQQPPVPRRRIINLRATLQEHGAVDCVLDALARHGGGSHATATATATITANRVAIMSRIQQGASWFLTVLLLSATTPTPAATTNDNDDQDNDQDLALSSSSNSEAAATTAFGGGGVDVLETIWKGLGMGHNNNNPLPEEPPQEQRRMQQQQQEQQQAARGD